MKKKISEEIYNFLDKADTEDKDKLKDLLKDKYKELNERQVTKYVANWFMKIGKKKNMYENRPKHVKVDKPKTIRKKTFKCLNQTCLLNSTNTHGCKHNCLCDNDLVIEGKAVCFGRDNIKEPIDKSKKFNRNLDPEAVRWMNSERRRINMLKPLH